MKKEQKQSAPDFQLLLDNYRKESYLLYEYTMQISNYCNTLKSISGESIEVDSALVEKQTISVLDHFWEELYKIRRCNKELEVLAKHLENVIGS
jgi:predicted nucleotidyltransferase